MQRCIRVRIRHVGRDFVNVDQLLFLFRIANPAGTRLSDLDALQVAVRSSQPDVIVHVDRRIAGSCKFGRHVAIGDTKADSTFQLEFRTCESLDDRQDAPSRSFQRCHRCTACTARIQVPWTVSFHCFAKRTTAETIGCAKANCAYHSFCFCLACQ